jgi:hypothetical protein
MWTNVLRRVLFDRIQEIKKIINYLPKNPNFLGLFFRIAFWTFLKMSIFQKGRPASEKTRKNDL